MHVATASYPRRQRLSLLRSPDSTLYRCPIPPDEAPNVSETRLFTHFLGYCQEPQECLPLEENFDSTIAGASGGDHLSCLCQSYQWLQNRGEVPDQYAVGDLRLPRKPTNRCLQRRSEAQRSGESFVHGRPQVYEPLDMGLPSMRTSAAAT
ncbi:uncharacterized protein PV07_06313 [Cladophialophora immunda]|uniref:Uncharacterized protein n=1 Tax=Cladophialophora immunda TaxID=569365 RepID=A0A0D2AZ71_9EURO|nr:uncharacterized protein PV07_06313 [Cladophialophora immunda]KIW30577.1 hypothetical protein PV07_06313 [Cladophialophora immunda]